MNLLLADNYKLIFEKEIPFEIKLEEGNITELCFNMIFKVGLMKMIIIVLLKH